MIPRRTWAMCALLLCFGPAMAQEAASSLIPASQPVFELKGVALGMTQEQVKAALPNADCDTLGDGSISDCFDPNSSFGGRPAQILVRLLEGKVVLISATRMTQTDAFDAADALKVKFGSPDEIRNVRVSLVRPDQEKWVVYRCPAWSINGGAQLLTVEPAAYTDKKRRFTYASVTLLDVHLHNDVWIAKKSNKASTNDL